MIEIEELCKFKLLDKVEVVTGATKYTGKIIKLSLEGVELEIKKFVHPLLLCKDIQAIKLV